MLSDPRTHSLPQTLIDFSTDWPGSSPTDALWRARLNNKIALKEAHADPNRDYPGLPLIAQPAAQAISAIVLLIPTADLLCCRPELLKPAAQALCYCISPVVAETGRPDAER